MASPHIKVGPAPLARRKRFSFNGFPLMLPNIRTINFLIMMLKLLSKENISLKDGGKYTTFWSPSFLQSCGRHNLRCSCGPILIFLPSLCKLNPRTYLCYTDYTKAAEWHLWIWFCDVCFYRVCCAPGSCSLAVNKARYHAIGCLMKRQKWQKIKK